MQNKTKSIIIGSGSYLPSRLITNDELSKTVDTNDAWITERTGIKQRYLVTKGELTSDLALNAAKKAINASGVSILDIDLIIVATTTPDTTFPSTAAKLQASLGMRKGASFDIQAVCAGFIYALSIADSMIKTSQARNILVVGAETMSNLLDWQDRSTCVLFGDGAGAVILSASDVGDSGIINTKLYSDGQYNNILYTDGGVASTGQAGKIRMLGREVFKHAITKMADSILQILSEEKLSIEDIDLLIPHQANYRIIEALATKLSFPLDKVISTVSEHANTSAASIPLALDHALRNNRIKKGNLVLLVAIGAGLTWGASLIKW
ncbi:3-oxoacyl-[acyl-carrier-protein] synthase 3 [Rickettsiales bacterium Ac37b]|nr:3-oxoacyl-[acyl-carrier-protein] synthase 3 [Rickettsiales bacterium Ac37b]